MVRIDRYPFYIMCEHCDRRCDKGSACDRCDRARKGG